MLESCKGAERAMYGRFRRIAWGIQVVSVGNDSARRGQEALRHVVKRWRLRPRPRRSSMGRRLGMTDVVGAPWAAEGPKARGRSAQPRPAAGPGIPARTVLERNISIAEIAASVKSPEGLSSGFRRLKAGRLSTAGWVSLLLLERRKASLDVVAKLRRAVAAALRDSGSGER